MKKSILIICMVLAVLLLVVACAPKQETQMKSQPAVKPAVTAPADDEPEMTPEQELERDEEETMLIEQANADDEEPEAPAETKKASPITISQDDLDDLKADLEGMEIEDLGGLTEQ